ncbi:alpha/beta fold hydrolase [Legionella israelensis]|uniref:Pimeloyl-[acyl-carrier protein] methyl ester esterase n=1 Tax=Legionella israelensis TaxID=454 RepID=A0A0W0VMT4_9GAMM|nr:alpha/beta fold hydrolase [Legionella israelensis]KTD21458.1 biotin biosynthesis protein BioH [Legionella israelensis]QBR84194.1 alpha/beta fold hydrolase [Legionella israelensis]QBS08454.1 alpha/beta fold hydrolase [Legionella israelensis]SCY15961.1 pimeloyl-[acyl-carrier protein] methyl ester esterase [Legionella israelensis DSM 19235]STX58093.1 biotin operon repressor and biotin [Legionella israelensis]
MTIRFNRQGRGRTLVFFHGWGFDSRIWHTLLPELTADFEVYCVDLPGFGGTPLMNWLTFKEELLDILPQTFVLLGWSLGGLYATRLSIEAPQRISVLINVAATPRFIKDKQWPGIEKNILDNFYQALCSNPSHTLQEFIKLQNRGLSLFDYSLDVPDKNSLKKGLNVLSEWDLREKLMHFTKPVCFMFGRLDAIVPVKTMCTMKKNYPYFHYIVFKKSAHMPFISHQNEFLESLRTFII